MLKRWASCVWRPKNRHGRATTYLPMEVIIEIALIFGLSSQRSYRTLSLVCKPLRAIAERECLPHLPIRLESTSAILAFHRLLMHRPIVASRVRHLWVRGAPSRRYKHHGGFSKPTAGTWRHFKTTAFEQLGIIHKCTNLISLACSFPFLFVCLRFAKNIFGNHQQLTELTLLENWDLWPCFENAWVEPDETHLFHQLTHLTLLDSVAPQFPVAMFPALQRFSAQVCPYSRHYALRSYETGSPVDPSSFPSLPHFPDQVHIILHLAHTSRPGNLKPAAESDPEKRTRVIAAVDAQQHFSWWRQRAGGGDGVWSAV